MNNVWSINWINNNYKKLRNKYLRNNLSVYVLYITNTLYGVHHQCTVLYFTHVLCNTLQIVLYTELQCTSPMYCTSLMYFTLQMYCTLEMYLTIYITNVPIVQCTMYITHALYITNALQILNVQSLHGKSTQLYIGKGNEKTILWNLAFRQKLDRSCYTLRNSSLLPFCHWAQILQSGMLLNFLQTKYICTDQVNENKSLKFGLFYVRRNENIWNKIYRKGFLTRSLEYCM